MGVKFLLEAKYPQKVISNRSPFSSRISMINGSLIKETSSLIEILLKKGLVIISPFLIEYKLQIVIEN